MSYICTSCTWFVNLVTEVHSALLYAYVGILIVSIFFFSPRQRFSGNRKKVLGVCIYLLEKAGQGKKAFEPHTYLKWKMHQILPDATWFLKKKDQLNHKLIINFLKTTFRFIFLSAIFWWLKEKPYLLILGLFVPSSWYGSFVTHMIP